MLTPVYNADDVTLKAKTQFDKNSHFGLWFEKFFNYQIYKSSGNFVNFDDVENLINHEEKDEKVKLRKKFRNSKNPQKEIIDYAHKKEKNEFFKDIISGNRTCGDDKALGNHAINQRLLCQTQGGIAQVYSNDWLMAIGLGNSHPLENGMLWHPTLGVPYFQGGTVKGMAKALMEKWGADPQLIKRWFGSVNLKDDKLAELYYQHFEQSLDDECRKQFAEQSTGAFIFLDAIPVKAVTLKKSMMTPHYGKWYEKGDENPTQADTQPSDWHSPVPIDFLAVESASMQFGVLPRKGADIKEGEIEQISNVITLALEHLGIGAKTATGYGHMQVDKKANDDYQERVEKLMEVLVLSKLSKEEQVILNFENHLNNLQTAWRGKPNIDCGFVDFYKKIIEWDNIGMLQKAYDVLITRGKEWQGKALNKNKRWKDRLKVIKEKL